MLALLWTAAGAALFGTTYGGGSGNYDGTLFELLPPAQPGDEWTSQVVKMMTGAKTGAQPFAGLTADAAGAYGGSDQETPPTANGLIFGFPRRTRSDLEGDAPVWGGDDAAPSADLLILGSTIYGHDRGRHQRRPDRFPDDSTARRRKRGFRYCLQTEPERKRLAGDFAA